MMSLADKKFSYKVVKSKKISAIYDKDKVFGV